MPPHSQQTPASSVQSTNKFSALEMNEEGVSDSKSPYVSNEDNSILPHEDDVAVVWRTSKNAIEVRRLCRIRGEGRITKLQC